MANKKLGAIFEKVRDAATDIASLDVVTLTGTISIKSTSGKTEIDLQEIYKTIQKQAVVDGDLKVVTFTHIDLDKDTTNFVTSELDEKNKPLIDAHNAMVATSQEARLAYIKLLKEFVGLS